MKFSASNTESREFQNPSTGPVSAVLIQIVDLGTQKTTWQGEEKFAKKVKFIFEIDEQMNDGRPFTVNRDFTASLHEKSALRTFLESWKGQKFSDEELGKFDPKSLLGKACTLNLVTSKDGKYVNIDSASKLMKGIQPIKPVNPVFLFDLDHFDQETFDKVWPWVQKKIQDSPEFNNRNSLATIQSDKLEDLPF